MFWRKAFDFRTAKKILQWYVPPSEATWYSEATEFDKEPLVEKVELAHPSKLKVVRLDHPHLPHSAPIYRGRYILKGISRELDVVAENEQIVPLRKGIAKKLTTALKKLGHGAYLEGWLSRFLVRQADTDVRTAKRFLTLCDEYPQLGISLRIERFADNSGRHLVHLKA